MTSTTSSTPGRNAAPRRTTQADVAKHAGVSAAIVSSVLNGRQYGTIRISEPTRARVLASVLELGYSPNLAARNLAGGSNKLIGVFTWQRLFPLLKDFFYEFLVGIEEASEITGFNLLMLTAAKDSNGERSIYPDGANGLQLADGGILLGWGERQDQIRRLDAEGYPFVFLGERHIEGIELSYVAADYLGATAAIVDRLVSEGHRRIGMIRNGYADEPIPGRRAGFEQGSAAHGAVTVSLGAMDDSSNTAIDFFADAAAAADWAIAHRLTALVVESSIVAVQIRDALGERGLRVPADISLVGLSGTPEIGSVADVTELSIPRREMGMKSVELLVQLLGDPTLGYVRATVDCGLRDAGTIGPVPL